MIQPLALSSIGFDDLSDSDSDESASHQHALASIGFDEDEDSSPVVSPLPLPAQVAAAVPAAARASEDKGLETLQLSAARPHSSAGPQGSLIDTQATFLSQFDDSSLAVDDVDDDDTVDESDDEEDEEYEDDDDDSSEEYSDEDEESEEDEDEEEEDTGVPEPPPPLMPVECPFVWNVEHEGYLWGLLGQGHRAAVAAAAEAPRRQRAAARVPEPEDALLDRLCRARRAADARIAAEAERAVTEGPLGAALRALEATTRQLTETTEALLTQIAEAAEDSRSEAEGGDEGGDKEKEEEEKDEVRTEGEDTEPEDVEDGINMSALDLNASSTNREEEGAEETVGEGVGEGTKEGSDQGTESEREAEKPNDNGAMKSTTTATVLPPQDKEEEEEKEEKSDSKTSTSSTPPSDSQAPLDEFKDVHLEDVMDECAMSGDAGFRADVRRVLGLYEACGAAAAGIPAAERAALARTVRQRLNQVSGDTEQIQRKAAELGALVCAGDGAQQQCAARLLADGLLAQAEDQVAPHEAAAFWFAAVAVGVAAHAPRVLDVLAGGLYRACALTVPCVPPRTVPGCARLLGARADEPPDRGLERTCGTMALFFAVLQTRLPRSLAAVAPAAAPGASPTGRAGISGVVRAQQWLRDMLDACAAADELPREVPAVLHTFWRFVGSELCNACDCDTVTELLARSLEVARSVPALPGTAGPLRLLEQLCAVHRETAMVSAHPSAINYLRDVDVQPHASLPHSAHHRSGGSGSRHRHHHSHDHR